MKKAPGIMSRRPCLLLRVGRAAEKWSAQLTSTAIAGQVGRVKGSLRFLAYQTSPLQVLIVQIIGIAKKIWPSEDQRGTA